MYRNSLIAVVMGNCYFVPDSEKIANFAIFFTNGKENMLSSNKLNIKTALIIFLTLKILNRM